MSIICRGTIDRRLESLIDKKGDAAELVLDGALLKEATAEVSLREMLKVCAPGIPANRDGGRKGA